MARLIVFGGLPGTGKSTISRRLARALPAAWLRIDAIEQALRRRRPELRDLRDTGYQIAAAVAESNLMAGVSVIADSVNPVRETRDMWAATAHAARADLLEVWVTCSDQAKHRRRVEHREPDIAGLNLPDWSATATRQFQNWPSATLKLDTAHVTPDEAVEAILSRF
ncbi:AAA family ATPase [Aliiroseovarius sp. PTFE2010]|uniref:AAA family ATPase n=1 Tax=Aliiroseovarius sp. PTFE2010 TaxID=3417190 RepID=UPI003CEDF099